MFFSPLSFLAGAASWTLAEYSLHRWLGHRAPQPGDEQARSAKLSGDIGPLHRKHHTDPSFFAPTATKVRAAAFLLPTLGTVASALTGPRRGISFAVGFTAMYVSYEVAHRRSHTHPPTNAYARWLRKHHMSHHYNAKFNHGVVTSLWDHVFGTYKEPGRVRVPRSIAIDWMLDAEGRIRPELAQDYELVGPGVSPTAVDDDGREPAGRPPASAVN